MMFTVDIFENSGHNVTGEIEQHEFETREEAVNYCNCSIPPVGHHFSIGEWEGNRLIDLSDYEAPEGLKKFWVEFNTDPKSAPNYWEKYEEMKIVAAKNACQACDIVLSWILDNWQDTDVVTWKWRAAEVNDNSKDWDYKYNDR